MPRLWSLNQSWLVQWKKSWGNMTVRSSNTSMLGHLTLTSVDVYDAECSFKWNFWWFLVVSFLPERSQEYLYIDMHLSYIYSFKYWYASIFQKKHVFEFVCQDLGSKEIDESMPPRLLQLEGKLESWSVDMSPLTTRPWSNFPEPAREQTNTSSEVGALRASLRKNQLKEIHNP